MSEDKEVPSLNFAWQEEQRKKKIEEERLEEEKRKAVLSEKKNIEQHNNLKPVGLVDKKEKEENLFTLASSSGKIDKFKISFIEEYEEEEAKRLIAEELGFEPLRPNLWQVVVKVYVRPEDCREIVRDDGKKVSIYLPASETGRDKFVNCVGLVLSKGPQANKGKFFEEHWAMKTLRFIFGKWMPPSIYVTPFRVGDWVIFDRNAGPQINYRGVPITILEDKNIRAVVEDPIYVSRY